jgi:hypothetical protein
VHPEAALGGGDLAQVLLDLLERALVQVGRRQQRDVRRDAGGVRVAEPLAPALQLAGVGLGQPKATPKSRRVIRAARQQSDALRRTAFIVSCATAPARAAPSASTRSSSAGSATSSAYRARTGANSSTTASATSGLELAVALAVVRRLELRHGLAGADRQDRQQVW